MKQAQILASLLWCSIVMATCAWTVEVADIAKAVSVESYTGFLRDKLGTQPGQNRAPPYDQGQHEQVRTTIRELFTSLGYTVREDPVTSDGHNIVAVKTGTKRPNDIILTGGHYDSKMFNDSGGKPVRTPGANDNASGTASIMEIARVLAPHQFEATIVLVAFDKEENGLLGSKAYLTSHRNDHVVRMLNIDTIAQNVTARNELTIDVRDHRDMAEEVVLAVRAYGRGVVPYIIQRGYYSDQETFEDAGIVACELFNNDFLQVGDPNYHQLGDNFTNPGYIDCAYATKVTAAAAAYLAWQAVPVNDGGPRFPIPPVDTAIAIGEEAVFTISTSGDPAPTLAWQRSDDGGATWKAIADATERSLRLKAQADMRQTQVRCVATNPKGSATSSAARLSIRAPTPPFIVSQPATHNVVPGLKAQFAIAYDASPKPTLQWQRSNDKGKTWTDIVGATQTSYAVNPATVTDNGAYFRCTITNSAGSVTTKSAQLQVPQRETKKR